jgi:hypothetical protein
MNRLGEVHERLADRALLLLATYRVCRIFIEGRRRRGGPHSIVGDSV